MLGSAVVGLTWEWLTVLRIRDVYTGSRILIFTHPGSRIQKHQGGWKKICCHILFCRYKFHKIVNYLIFKVLKKKIWASFKKIIELFTQKFVTILSKIWVWDPRSGIRKKTYTGCGSRGQKGTGYRIRNTGGTNSLLFRIFLFTILYFNHHSIITSIHYHYKGCGSVFFIQYKYGSGPPFLKSFGSGSWGLECRIKKICSDLLWYLYHF